MVDVVEAVGGPGVPGAEGLGRGSTAARPASASYALVLLYCVTAFLSSALLFVVEPMVARLLVPMLGGAASVWNAAMVFFQVALLVGYLVADLTSGLRGRLRPSIQISIVAFGAVVLPVAIPDGWLPPVTGGQSWWVLTTMAVIVGLPFMALATLSPTLQGWFAETDHPRASDPYFLYAAGNVGSAVGLLAYPLVIEPLLGVGQQARAWAIAYGGLLVLLVLCAVAQRRHRASAPAFDDAAQPDLPRSGHDVESTAITHRDRLRWIALAAVPSAMLLAVTRHLATDVASIPLLWVIPLLVYLATFVVAFGRPTTGPSDGLVRWTMIATVPVIATMGGLVGSMAASFVFHLLGFATMALVCHVLLAARRPTPRHLTEYFFWISFGGVVGGVAVALVAPAVFERVTEYPLLVMCGLAVLATIRLATPNRAPAWVVATSIVVATGLIVVLSTRVEDHATLIADAIALAGGVLFVIARQPRTFAIGMALLLAIPTVVDLEPTVYRSRSFFGVSTVSDAGEVHRYVHGTTVHGEQVWRPRRTTEPRGYYRRGAGLGRMLSALDSSEGRMAIGAVGLGSGNIASYGRAGDRYEFFEIDPDVVEIARNPELFTFLRDSPAEVDVTVGDGRLAMAATRSTYDVVVLDAFSSDAIPTHLLTREALGIYREHLASDGVMLAHISNRYFDLRQVIARVARTSGLDAWVLDVGDSVWMALAPSDVRDAARDELESWDRVEPSPDTPLWTDDYTNLLATLDAF